MNKPYGYKEKDLISLARFISGGGFNGKSLSAGFSEYARANGKSAGSVRNLYYALSKYSRENPHFTEKYLGGNAIKVEKSESFSAQEVKTLISQIEDCKKNGLSVRRATIMLADGDAKKALRFQNKYRTLRRAGETASGQEQKIVPAKDFLLTKLKNEIDKLTERLFSGLRRENERLKKEVFYLKDENTRLYRQLYGKNGRVVGYFKQNGDASRVLHP